MNAMFESVVQLITQTFLPNKMQDTMHNTITFAYFHFFFFQNYNFIFALLSVFCFTSYTLDGKIYLFVFVFRLCIYVCFVDVLKSAV